MSRDHVFISYARKDAAFVSRLTKRLKSLQLAAWRDIDALRAGEYWQEAIDKALSSAAALVVVLSPRAVKSAYVAYEWAFALGAGIKVIPIITGKIAKASIHPRLSGLQFVDFTKRGKPWLRLIDALELEAPGAQRSEKAQIRAAFDIKSGKPKKEGDEYIILLSIDRIPAGATRATYEAHDESFDPRTWPEKNPKANFSTWMKSYGDVLLSADIRTPDGVTRIETTLYNALLRKHAQDENRVVRGALRDIKGN
jgi:hypothetical protein